MTKEQDMILAREVAAGLGPVSAAFAAIQAERERLMKWLEDEDVFASPRHKWQTLTAIERGDHHDRNG